MKARGQGTQRKRVLHEQDNTQLGNDAERQEFLEYRNFLMTNEYQVAGSLEQALLTLSGGALGLSIVFVKDFAPQPVFKELLGYSWMLFVITLLTTLLAMYFAQMAFRYQVNLLDKSYSLQEPSSSSRNIYGSITKFLNMTSILCFVGGVIFMIAFALENLS